MLRTIWTSSGKNAINHIHDVIYKGWITPPKITS